MSRRQSDADRGRCALAIFLLIGSISCFTVYRCILLVVMPSSIDVSSNSGVGNDFEDEDNECCRGIDHLELWGDAVKWGSDFKFNSSKECCLACKTMCAEDAESCLCDSWVFCGDRVACGARFGECWLKKQKNSMEPDRRDSGDQVMWTSGLVFGKGEGIIGLETEYGLFHIKLLPACAPHSVNYILELLASRRCPGCQFYRAESRGSFWNFDGDHVQDAPYGPPYALIQGTLEAHGTIFKEIPKEECGLIRRGSVAWVGSGPEFFISLANHHEWLTAFTVFGSVLSEDIEIVEKIAQLPTKSEVWHNINVSVLEKPIALRLQTIKAAS